MKNPPFSLNFNPFEARERVDLSHSNFTKITFLTHRTKFRVGTWHQIFQVKK